MTISIRAAISLALARVIYFMLTGHSPFRADSTMGVLNRIGNDSPRSLRTTNPDVPLWLDHVVMRLLDKARDARYSTADAVGDLLEDALAHLQQPSAVALPAELANLAGLDRQGPPINKLLIGSGCAFSLILAGILIVLQLGKGTLRIESDADDVPIRVMQGDEVYERLTVNQTGTSIRIGAGKYTIQLEGDTSSLMVEDGEITLNFGESATTKIAWKQDNRNRDSIDPKRLDNLDVSGLKPQIDSSTSAEVSLQNYDLTDLLSVEPDIPHDEQLSRILHNLMHVVAPEIWKSDKTQIAKAKNSLIVMQTESGHRTIKDYLESINVATIDYRSEAHVTTTHNPQSDSHRISQVPQKAWILPVGTCSHRSLRFKEALAQLASCNPSDTWLSRAVRSIQT